MKINRLNRMRRFHAFTMVPALLVVMASATIAEEHEHESENPHGESEIAAFLGTADANGSAKAEFAIGIEYEFRMNRWFGIGGFADYTPAEDAMAIGVPLFIHAHRFSRLKFLIAPGYLLNNGEDEHGEKEENSFLVRVGLAYTFPITERMGLAPVFQVDFFDKGEEDLAYVYGAYLVWIHGKD